MKNYTLLMVLSVLCYRLNDALSKTVVSHIPPFAYMSLRSFVTLIAFAFIFNQRENLKRFCFDRMLLMRNTLAGIALIFEILSLQSISLSVFVLINYLVPVFTKLIAARVLKEAFSRQDVVITILCGLGFFGVVSGEIMEGDLEGVLCALAGAVFFAGSLVITKKVSLGVDHQVVFLTYILIILGICVPTSLIFEHTPSSIDLGLNFIGLTIVIAVFHIFGFLMSLRAIQNSRLSIIFWDYIGIPIAMALDFVIWKAVPSVPQVLGGLIILSALVFDPIRGLVLTKQKPAPKKD